MTRAHVSRITPNEFGYPGVPNSSCDSVTTKIEDNLNVIIDVEVQSTHTFDLNAQDAMFHASFKHEIKKEGAPSREGGAGEFRKKVMNVYRDFDVRTIQKGFMRVYSRDKNGDLDEDLIPEASKEWYLDEASDVSNFETYVDDDEIHSDESSSDLLIETIQLQNDLLIETNNADIF